MNISWRYRSRPARRAGNATACHYEVTDDIGGHGAPRLCPPLRDCYRHSWSDCQLIAGSTAGVRRSRLPVGDETFKQVGRSFQLLPVFVDGLSDRSAVIAHQRPRDPSADPQEGSYYQDKRQPGYDQTDKPGNVLVHFRLRAHGPIVDCPLVRFGAPCAGSAVPRRPSSATGHEALHQVVRPFELVPVLVNDLADRFSVTTDKGPCDPPPRPNDRPDHCKKRQCRDDQAEPPRRLLRHRYPPFRPNSSV